MLRPCFSCRSIRHLRQKISVRSRRLSQLTLFSLFSFPCPRPQKMQLWPLPLFSLPPNKTNKPEKMQRESERSPNGLRNFLGSNLSNTYGAKRSEITNLLYVYSAFEFHFLGLLCSHARSFFLAAGLFCCLGGLLPCIFLLLGRISGSVTLIVVLGVNWLVVWNESVKKLSPFGVWSDFFPHLCRPPRPRLAFICWFRVLLSPHRSLFTE